MTSSSRRGPLLLPHLQYPAPDDGEDQADEEDEGDGDPVLHRGPVVSEEDPDMFDGDEDREDTPGDQEAEAGLETADYQQHRAHQAEQSIEDGVLE